MLISDVTAGVEDCIDAVKRLGSSSPGEWMKAFTRDFDAGEGRLDGLELHDISAGEPEYKAMITEVSEGVQEHLNERFASMLKDPVLKAACIFEHSRWPSESARARLENYGEAEIETLLTNYGTLFDYLGGNRSAVLREWTRLKLEVMKDSNLRTLKYHELYERCDRTRNLSHISTSQSRPISPDRLFDQFSEKTNPRHFYNVLLLAAFVHIIAVDTSICERGFALMNNLKTARRSLMKKALLRLLMTICSLGAEWKDPSKIPVKEIIEEWRAQSSRGRYESQVWSAPALAELVGAADGGDGSGGGGGAPMPQVAGPAAGAGEEAGDGDGIMAATLFSWMGGGRAS